MTDASRNVDPAEVVRRLVTARDDACERSFNRGGMTRYDWVAQGQAFESGCNATLAALSEHFLLLPRDSESFEKMVSAAWEDFCVMDPVPVVTEADPFTLLFWRGKIRGAINAALGAARMEEEK